MPRGQFIVLEGIDGSGTTLQCGALCAALRERGHQVLETREPSGGSIGRLVRESLAMRADPLDPQALALLFAADRLDHVAREVEPALAAGTHVICDRYLLSSWAYQALDAPLAWVKAINGQAPWPDLTLWLDVPVEIALSRVAAREQQDGTARERFEVPELQRRVAESYATLARDPALSSVHTVDGTPAPRAVTDALIAICASAGL